MIVQKHIFSLAGPTSHVSGAQWPRVSPGGCCQCWLGHLCHRARPSDRAGRDILAMSLIYPAGRYCRISPCQACSDRRDTTGSREGLALTEPPSQWGRGTRSWDRNPHVTHVRPFLPTATGGHGSVPQVSRKRANYEACFTEGEHGQRRAAWPRTSCHPSLTLSEPHFLPFE